MKMRVWVLLVMITGSVVLGGCRSTSPDDQRGSHRTSQTSSQPRPDLPPPPGLDQRVITPLRDDALVRAKMTLIEVIESIPTPDFLQVQDSQVEHAPAAAPPVAAQRAYIAGRLAWREGDSFESIRHLQSALRLAPDQPDILRLLGRIYTGMGNKVRGAQYFREAVQADPTDLEGVFLLGRFALEQGDWRQAAIMLHTAVRLAQTDDSPLHPAIRRLGRYYLANALMHSGHAAAAIEQYQRFLTNGSYLPHTTPFARELELLDQQAGTTLLAVGDLYHQLDEPRQARSMYDRAAEAGVMDQAGLIRRQIYSYLRLGLDEEAQKLTIEKIHRGRVDATAIGLVRYLIEQGAAGPDFARQLASVYRGEDPSAALALALADLLPTDEAQTLLVDHLKHRPRDQVVFDRLLTHYLLPDRAASSSTDLGKALAVTAELMAASPEHAEPFALALIRTAGSRSVLDVLGRASSQAADSTRTLLMRDVLHGLAAADAGHIAQAQALFEGVLEAQPDLAVARLQLAKLMIYQQQFEQAARLLEPLADRDDPGVIALRVHVLSETGQIEEALALLDEMIRKGDAATSLVLQKARLQVSQGEAVAAERTLLDALNMHPQDERLYEALFDLYEPKTGQSEIPDSMRQWQRLVRRMLGTIPYSRIGRLVRADLHSAKGELAQAEALLQELLDENDHDARALRDLLELYLRANRRDDALGLLERRAANNLNDPQLLALVGRFYKELDEYEKMLDIVEQLLLIRPDDAERSLALARLRLDRDQPAEAAELAQNVLNQEAVADPPAVMNLLGEALLKLDRGDEAERQYHAAIERFPDHAADLTYALAALVSQRGERDRADRMLLGLLERFPDHGPANNDLGYNWVSRGENLQRALAMIRKAVDSDPQSAAYLDSLGWAYYKLGRFEEAELWLRRSRQAQGGHNPVIVDHLGDALYQLGNAADAVRAWEEAILLRRTGLPARFEQTGNVLFQLGRVADAAHLWLQARAMTRGSYETMDPEMSDIIERAQAKIDAVNAEQEPQVAPVAAP